MELNFEWDKKKAAENFRKHRVSFEEAGTVFSDLLSLTIHDPTHSISEDRFVIVGESLNRRILVVVHTERKDRIRIISARPANQREKKIYEESN